MHHPLSVLPDAWKRGLFLCLAVLAAASLAAMWSLARPLDCPAAPCGIVSFEFVRDYTAVERILAMWGPEGQTRAAFLLGFDFLFLVCYSTALAMAVLWAGGGGAFASSMWLAALLDAIENAVLAALLFGRAFDPWPAAARYCAFAKFLLVAAGLIYVAWAAWRRRLWLYLAAAASAAAFGALWPLAACYGR
jgi:hypothetical protein